MTVNTYAVRFIASCPNNDVPVVYALSITTDGRVISVEQIVEETQRIHRGYHEDIADQLLERLGGRQTLVAQHHGVEIQTIRESA